MPKERPGNLAAAKPRRAKEEEKLAAQMGREDVLSDGLEDPLGEALADPLDAQIATAPPVDGTAPAAAVQGESSGILCFGCVAGGDTANVVQMKDGGLVQRAEGIHETASEGLSGSAGTLPHLEQIQQAFGDHDVSGIEAHTDSEACQANAELGSQAFARGNEVAFGSSPDLATAAHEATHVVQQRAGVSLPDGVGREGDTHERKADAVASAVVQGKSAAAMLDQYQGTGGEPAVQYRSSIANPAAKPGKPGGRSHPSAKGEKPFTKRELGWINQVLKHRLVSLLFSSYSDVPTAVLHRVASIAGAKGQFSAKKNDIAVSDKVYSQKDTHTAKNGTRFKETDEEAFKGTLIHELFHFAEHHAKLRKGGLVLPSDLVQVMSKPTLAGFPAYAFGWFVHPKSKYILHFQLSDVAGFDPNSSILGYPDLMKVRKNTGAWERSPMPQSGNSISAEEDMCESISLALASKRTQAVLASQFPLRYKLLDNYFGSLLRMAAKSRTP